MDLTSTSGSTRPFSDSAAHGHKYVVTCRHGNLTQSRASAQICPPVDIELGTLRPETCPRSWTYFNGHVGEGNTGDEEVMGKFGVKERNFEGQMVVDFAKRMDMGVVNTYFQKREEHRVTYKSGGRRTQVDYILCRRGNLKEISDCKVVVGESVARQHRMVVCRMTLMVCKKKRSKIEIEKKAKWWKLKKEECCEEFRQKLRQALGGQVVLPDDWETTAEVIRETGRKVLGVSSGRRKEDKETWWWNEEVQDSVQSGGGTASGIGSEPLPVCWEQVEENLERWRFALERRGMKVSRSKTEYMCVNEREGSGRVRLQGEEVKKVQEFKYLGSTVQSNGECGKEVKKRVQAGWNGWRKVSGVLCDRKISARIKGKVYRTVVRAAMLYGLETVSLRKRQESELEVAELKMLSTLVFQYDTRVETDFWDVFNQYKEMSDVQARPSPAVQEARCHSDGACCRAAGRNEHKSPHTPTSSGKPSEERRDEKRRDEKRRDERRREEQRRGEEKRQEERKEGREEIRREEKRKDEKREEMRGEEKRREEKSKGEERRRDKKREKKEEKRLEEKRRDEMRGEEKRREEKR
ncbi:hypothetical protein QTP70_008678 [Hemibagrus guttatus]|uniref:Uncharacterized protein n=1 Tax=Hemibagrus guttatus TaxID=175788 RepID=A0AAE0Q0D9_9TELE|nr:hypothetical protein QTP70_008678 [Hemibagrus guttatus]